MQQTIPEVKTIQSKDINSFERLPTIALGIRDEYIPSTSKSQYIDLRHSKLNEAFDQSKRNEVQQVVRYALNGGDYHRELAALHRNVPQYIHDTNTTNPQDDYIHEVLGRGKPSGETVAHIHEVIHGDAGQGYSDYSERANNQEYLMNKWEPFLDAHAKHPHLITKQADANYTPEELSKISSKFEVKGLRLLRHESSGHYYELHPTHGLRYVGSRFNSMYNSSDEDNPNRVFDKVLSREVTPTSYVPEVKRYTLDSAPVNRYLHKKYDDPMHVPAAPWISEHADTISKHFEESNPLPHIPDFHVYTGVYQQLNPRIHSSHRDENGNFIFHNPSFTSTSIDKHTADYFAKKNKDSNYVASDDNSLHLPIADVLKIRIPSGYPHGAYVKPISDHEEENEYLLDKGHTFILDPTPVHYATKNKIIRMWHAELHPKDVDASIPFEQRTRNQKIDTVMHPNVTSEDIEKAAIDDDSHVRAVAAKHPRIHPESLKTLASDQMPRVRIAAMMNESASDKLMKDSIGNYSSALGIARRKKVPEHLMHDLVNHDFSSVSEAIAQRHDLTDNHLGMLISADDYDNKIQTAMAANPTIHPDILHELRKHPEESVRLNIARNPNTHQKTLDELKNDNDYEVRTAANRIVKTIMK